MWQVDRMMSLPTYDMDGELMLRRSDVLALMDRRCRDCRHYRVRTEPHYRLNKLQTRELCVESVEKLTGGHKPACKRFA